MGKEGIGTSMKAVVMENKNKVCAVLCDDGTFRKVKGDYPVGTELVYEDVMTNDKRSAKKRFFASNTLKYLGALAAAVLLFTGVSSYEMVLACSYVTLDVNPSIEYALNRLNRVISVTAINDDAKDVVESLNESGIKMSELDEAIDMTVDELKERGYLADDDSAVLIDVVSDTENRESKLADSVESTEVYNSGTTSVVCLSSSQDSRNEAMKQGISTGRYEVMLETQRAEGSFENAGSAEDDNIEEADAESVETYKTRSVKELINEIRVNNGEITEEMTDKKEPENTESMQDEAGFDKSAPSDMPQGVPSGENGAEMTTAPDNTGTEKETKEGTGKEGLTGTENGSGQEKGSGTMPDLPAGQDKTQMNGTEGISPPSEGGTAPTGTPPDGSGGPGSAGSGGAGAGSGSAGKGAQSNEGGASQMQGGQMNDQNGGQGQTGGQMNGQGNANGTQEPGNP